MNAHLIETPSRCAGRLWAPGARALAVALLATWVCLVKANSAGSPICEVHSLPLVEMSKTLADPPPQGWFLQAERPVYFAGQPVRIRLRNPVGSLEVRGVLLWAKAGPTTGAGRFELPANGRWQYIPASSNCAEWALSHTDGVPKPQSLLEFDWVGGESPTAVFRAFLVEDCGGEPGHCRDHQGLTDLIALERGIFRAGFED